MEALPGLTLPSFLAGFLPHPQPRSRISWTSMKLERLLVWEVSGALIHLPAAWEGPGRMLCWHCLWSMHAQSRPSTRRPLNTLSHGGPFAYYLPALALQASRS